MDQSGLIAVKTAFLSRTQAFRRPGKLPRPPLSLNLALLLFAAIVSAVAALHRAALEERFISLVHANESAPFEIQRLRRDLAAMELDEKSLHGELDARLKYARSVKGGDFYILLDTKGRKFTFRYRDRVVREAPLEVGPPATIQARGHRWTFAPLTGAFNAREKREDAVWEVPTWAYAMNGEPAPRPLPRVPNGLGRYVIVLSGDYVIHSPPSRESPLKGAKPGSFMVPEADLAAIWRRVGPETRVYVF